MMYKVSTIESMKKLDDVIVQLQRASVECNNHTLAHLVDEATRMLQLERQSYQCKIYDLQRLCKEKDDQIHPMQYELKEQSSKYQSAVDKTVIEAAVAMNLSNQQRGNAKTANDVNLCDMMIDTAKREEAYRMKMYAKLAHDLKTPIHVMMMSLQLLESNASDTSSIPDLVAELSARCNFMVSTINNSLKFQQLQKTMKPTLSSFNISTSIIKLISWFQVVVAADQKNIAFDFKPVCDALLSHSVISDIHWFEQAIMCYLSNAVKYSQSGLVSVSCTIVDVGNDKYIECAVVDDGKGIDEEQRSKLFQQVSHESHAAVIDNIGLSLFSLKCRIESIGGSCGIQSKVDGSKGAHFWFRMPYVCDNITVTDPTERAGAAARILSNSPQSSSNISLHILVVEDSPIVLKLLMKQLTSVGHTCSAAVNGLEGLNMMMAHKYDAVIMDMHMPVLDGIECTSRYRQYEQTQGSVDGRFSSYLPIIASSAGCDPQRVAAFVNAGADIFIPKPFKLQAMVDALASLSAAGYGRCISKSFSC